MLTAFGAAAVTFMVCMYALERRHRRYIFAFACGCALSSAYGFLAGTWRPPETLTPPQIGRSAPQPARR